MRLAIDPQWLLDKIAAEPDELSCEAGVLHPEAPIPAAIASLSPRSTDLGIMAIMEQFVTDAYTAAQKAAYLAMIEQRTLISGAVLEALWAGASGEALP